LLLKWSLLVPTGRSCRFPAVLRCGALSQSYGKASFASSSLAGWSWRGGTTTVEPDQHVVGDCIGQMGSRMAGYALDVGVLDSGQTAVVEVTEGFSLGGYGASPAAMVDVLIARWTQLIQEAAE
jgi:hypothetical protein